MYNIDKIMGMLDSENPDEIQQKGIQLAHQLKDLHILIQPMNFGSKAVWNNCAKILAEKTDDELEPYLVNLIEWIQDINWPGAFVIMNRLKIFSGEKLKNPFLKFVNNAIKLNNEEGFMWLDYLSELLDNESLKKELPTDILQVLQKHYHNWAWWYKE